MKGEGIESKPEEQLLRPIIYTTKAFYVAIAVLIGTTMWSGYAWWTQLTQGLVVTGMRDLGVSFGSPWGVYIANFIWYVGIAHGGIAVSAGIRITKLEKYRPIARMAELLTVITLLMAGLSIVFDLGRPDRIFFMIIYYWDRIGQSPLIWDLTVIFAYSILSVTYLYLTMREDIATYLEKLPRRWRWFYKPFLLGYSPGEKEKVDQIAWWIAITLIVLMALLSGGVIPWLFGLMVSQAGWYGAVQGPYFLTAALVSAISGIIIIASIIRRLFRWEKQIKPEIFKGLGTILAVLTVIYLWFILHEQLTIRYAGPTTELAISDALLMGSFSPIYWTMLIVGLILPFIYLAIQAIYPKVFSLKGTVISAILILVALWVKRFLLVVISLLYPRLPYPVGSYTPTWVEWSLVLGTLAIASLLYIVFIKIYPIIELKRS